MTDAIKCVFSHLNGTPVFAIPAGMLRGDDMKRIFGATFLAEKGVWLFPAFAPFIEDVLHDLEIIVPGVEFDSGALAQIDKEIKICTALARRELPQAYRDDFEFIVSPFEHQKEQLNYMLHLPRCAIFYDCGLGKSKGVIDFIRHEGEKTLILSPIVGLKTWEYEAQLHSDGKLHVEKLLGTPKQKKEILEKKVSQADILVAGYDSAKRYDELIVKNFPYRVIVADESHNLRDHRSARTKAALGLAARAWRRYIMSGTPSLGNPMHLYGQLAFLGRYVPAASWYIFKKFYTMRAKGNPRICTGYKNLDMLNDKVQRVATRKIREECLDLPKRKIIDVAYILEKDQRKMYNELVTLACADLGKGKLYESEHAAITLQKLLQVLSGFLILPPPEVCDGCEHLKKCVEQRIKPFTSRCHVYPESRPQEVHWLKGNAKLDTLSELLDSFLAEERNKIIIWCHFTQELNSVEKCVAEHLGDEYRYIRIDGSNSRHGQAFAEQFQNDPQTRVWIGQIGTGVVLTLTAASYMIYYGLSFKLDEYLQSMDRNYRIGQDKPVFVYRLIAEHSALEFVAEALKRKINIAETLTDRIDCALCNNFKACFEQEIEPFKKGCIYRERISRVIARPRPL